MFLGVGVAPPPLVSMPTIPPRINKALHAMQYCTYIHASTRLYCVQEFGVWLGTQPLMCMPNSEMGVVNTYPNNRDLRFNSR